MRRARRRIDFAGLLGTLAVLILLLGGSAARAQEKPGEDARDRRLEELERKLEGQQRALDEQSKKIADQAKELEALKARLPAATAPVGSAAPPAVPLPPLAGAPELVGVDGPGAPRPGVTTPSEIAPKLAPQISELEGSGGRAVRRGATPRPQGGPANALTEEAATGPPRGAGGQPIEDAFHLSYDNGFSTQGKILGEDYYLRFMGRLHLDYRFWPTGQENAPEDRFLVRRARIGLLGTIGPFRYRFELAPIRLDSPNPSLPITHFWLAYEQFPELQPLFGHFKTPFTLEDGLMSSNWIDFVERAMVVGSGDGVAPHYRPGAEVYGELGRGYLQYWLSVQNQLDENNDPTDDVLVAGRLETDFLGATLGGDAYGERLGGDRQRSFRGLTPGKFTFFEPVSVRGWTVAWSADVSFYVGPFWIRSEYVWAEQARENLAPGGGDEPALLVRGGYADIGWHFWGPPAGSPRPQAPFKGWELFSPEILKLRNKPDVGMELVFRAQYEDFSDAPRGLPFRDFFFGTTRSRAASGGANAFRGARVFSLDTGINFDPIEGVRFMANWCHLKMEKDARREAPRRPEADEFLFRAQVAF